MTKETDEDNLAIDWTNDVLLESSVSRTMEITSTCSLVIVGGLPFDRRPNELGLHILSHCEIKHPLDSSSFSFVGLSA